jgi:hypothetical protein
MSLLLTHNLPEAVAIFRGEIALPGQPEGFRIDNETVTRWTAIEAAPGHQAVDFDGAWASVVRAWWGLGATWGVCASGEHGEVSWNLVLPGHLPSAIDAVPAHLTGARLQPGMSFARITGRLRELPFQAAMAGHPGTGDSARIEPAVRSMIESDFLLLFLAKAVPRPGIEAEIQRLAQEEQFLRDEHLARPGLEQDNHSAAAQYLALIEAATERANTALQEGAWRVRVILATGNEQGFRRAQSLIHSAYAGDGGKPEPLRWQETSDPRSLTFLRTVELAALSRPPQRELPGFSIETRIARTSSPGVGDAPVLFATSAPDVSEQQAVALGRILDDSGTPRGWFQLPIADLSRHLLIAGMTGSGKTISCEQVLLELWREHRIPWLVVEPGLKTGYRRLANSEIGSDLDLWAVGVPRTRRLPLNPMAVPAGVGLAEHTSALFAVISSAFELVAPMPEVLATAIEETYRRHGWSLAGVVPEGPAPELRDLIDEIDRCARRTGHSAEVTANIRAGLLLRMQRLANGSLAPEFNSTRGLDVASMVKRPTLIELSALPDAASQALVMGLIALQLRHHWRLAGQSDTLRHVTVIEEAHRLLRAVPETAANSSRNRATEDLANMLAELRGFGAGLIIVDQTPSALVSAVIANTGTKLLHRLDHPDDRELAGRAAGLPADHVDLLGSLRPGDAILRTDRRPRPFRLRMPNPSVTYGLKPLPALPLIEDNPPPKKPCSVCWQSNCPSASAGLNPDKMRHRIAKFLAEIQAPNRNGAESAWQWAGRELHASGINTATAQDHLCFLIALAETANLSAKTIRRIREAFEPKIQ